MPPTSVHSRSRRAFTLVELMVTVGLAAIVMAGMLNAYTFLGRNLTGLSRLEKFDGKSQRLLVLFGRDVGAATAVTSASTTAVTFILPSGAVSYAWDSGAQTFTRTAGGASETLLGDVIAAEFKYYSRDGDLNPTAISVKQVQLTLTGALGTDKNSKYVTRSVATATLPLASKALLQ